MNTAQSPRESTNILIDAGGNPLGDRYGFRYWKEPGSFAELYYEGNLGRFLGFLQCLILASFTIAGPDYVAMAAGEAENPRVVMPRAFNAVFYRLTCFFVLGSLCVGINVPYNDPELIAAFENEEPGAAASPYVVSMNRLRIQVLPDIVNALVLASAFSAGNSYVYCASRSLFGLALEGKAPKILTRSVCYITTIENSAPLTHPQNNPQRRPNLLRPHRPRHLPPSLSPSLQRLRYRPVLVRQPDHRLPTHQLQRHLRHIPLLAPRPPRPEHQPRLSALQSHHATRRSIPGHDLYHGHGVRGRVSSLTAWAVGRTDFLV